MNVVSVIPSMKTTGCKILALFCAVIASTEVLAQDKVAKPRPRSGLLFESKIENPKVFSAVDGAKRTLLVPAYEWEYGVRIYTKETWKELGVEWNDYVNGALKVADTIVKNLKPEWVRDHRNVINYAILQSDDPFLSSVLLSKKLHPMFKEKLGENIHIVIPERGTLYLFPAEGGKLDGYGPSIVKRFKTSKNPVSVEVFLLTADSFRVVGELEQ